MLPFNQQFWYSLIYSLGKKHRIVKVDHFDPTFSCFQNRKGFLYQGIDISSKRYIFCYFSARSRCDTRSIFLMWSLTGLNSKFSFSYAGLPYLGWSTQYAQLFTLNWMNNSFPKVLALSEMEQSRPRFELVSSNLLFTTVTIEPRTPPFAWKVAYCQSYLKIDL